MKKTVITLLFSGLLFTACKNETKPQDQKVNTEKNTNIKTEAKAKTTNDSKTKPYAFDYIYKNNEGENLNVTFFEDNKKMYVKIMHDSLDVTLKQENASAKGGEYLKDNYKWISKNNDAIFTDGENEMKLTLVSPLQYTFSNDNNYITVAYINEPNKNLAFIKTKGQADVILKQTNAWAKGAEYENNGVKWHVQNNKGTLTKKGVTTEYTQKQN